MNLTKKITLSGILTAFGVLIPQAFHIFGMAAGTMFLPMHIPVLMAGFIVGPGWALIVGILSPLLSSLITGMPPAIRLPYMVCELAIYGFVVGFLYHICKLHKHKLGIYISLIGGMIVGRIVYIGAFAFLVNAIGIAPISQGSILAVIKSFPEGIIGMVIQIIFIPPIIYALKKAKLITLS